MNIRDKAEKRLRNASAVQFKVDRTYYEGLSSLNQVKTEVYSQDDINELFSKGGCYEGL